MKFSIEPEIFARWPGIRVGVVVITNLDNRGKSAKVEKLLRAEEERQGRKLADMEMSQIPQVAAWRKIYKEFGSDPGDYRSSVEALLQRVRAKKPLPAINKLVDMYNYLSIKYWVPAGAEDTDKVTGDISLALAQGTEAGVYLGSEEEETCYPGEVIYKDREGFICRRWNWREAERTKIDADTRNAVLVFETVPGVEDVDIGPAMAEAELLLKSWGGSQVRVEKFVLSQDKPELEVDLLAGSVGTGRLLPGIGGRLQKRLARAVGEVTGQPILPEEIGLEHPEVEEHGDYATNIALELKGGRQLAEKIVEKLNGRPSFAESFGRARVAGPGFINIKLGTMTLIDGLDRAHQPPQTKKGKRVVVEYTDPNPFKEFHIGHLISNITGESLCRLQEAVGAIVWRANYFGDVGVHVAKSIWGIQKKMSQDGMTLEKLAKRNLVERVKYMGQGYALGSRAFEEDVQTKEEIGRLNTVLYVAAQKMWQEQKKEPVINYDPDGKISSEQVGQVYDLYKNGREWSLEYFETIYHRLGTKFDGYYPESRMGEVGYKLVIDNIGKVFEKSEGAVVFKGEKFGLHTRVFINKHNLPTYEAKELGLAPAKYQDFPYDESIIVVGKEIKEYFVVLVEALKQVDVQLGSRTLPICTGMVTVPGGKMGSRFGNVVTVTGLLDQLKPIVREKIKDSAYTDKEAEEISEKVAVGSIKYAFLKSTVGQDIVFDMERSLSLEGNSGPYLQYTYARCHSVLAKTDEPRSPLARIESPPPGELILNEEELRVLRWIYRYSEVVAEAVLRNAPNLVCNFLYELAQRYNTFYNQHSILSAATKPQKIFRLRLTTAVGKVLKNGLNLLGIEALERM